jgi:DNA phosphorothioation-associated putative methyltransferase
MNGTTDGEYRRPEVGKRVHGALYLHRDALPSLDGGYRKRVEAACEIAGEEGGAWNVVKFEKARPHRVTLLVYEPFEEAAFPALLQSFTIDLSKRRVTKRSFRGSANPPILHRKELLIPTEHPNRRRFTELTAALEARGLFDDPRKIGFKKSWDDRLRLHGVKVVGSDICDDGGAGGRLDNRVAGNDGIDRHRTAIVRDRLSAPMLALARHGLLTTDRSVLDYGCGQGDDVRALKVGGIRGVGWDPHYATDAPLDPSDIVNLGFVLNVIEEPGERADALRRAYELSRQCLAVAAMVVGKADTTALQPYQDGFVTRRGTFQKYYRQEELGAFIEEVLGAEAIAVGPGVFFVFRDKLLEQRFFLDRQRRRFAFTFTDFRPPRDRPTAAERRIEVLRPVLEALWKRMLELGRRVDESELDAELAEDINRRIGSLRRADRLARSLFEFGDLEAAKQARRDDILVYFALNLFSGGRRYSELPPELQRDVKAFFGSHRSAQDAARELLFSLGQPQVIDAACRHAREQGLGWLEDGDSLHLHSALVERLPPALRCYVGCAAKLYGDVETADLVKIHIRSGKLTLLFYDDFDSSPLPRLRERIKIDIRAQRIDFFDYSRRRVPQLLYLRSRFMADDQDGYQRQHAFDEALRGIALFDFGGFGPDADVFFDELKAQGYVIDVGAFGLLNSNSS